jgi:hypothetical protein
MLKDLVELLQQDAVQPYYIGLCMAMMVLPMLGLAIWFHRRIGDSEGGRRLMRENGKVPPTRSRSPIAAGRQLGHAAALFKSIQSGAYGGEVRGTYKVVCGSWSRSGCSQTLWCGACRSMVYRFIPSPTLAPFRQPREMHPRRRPTSLTGR